MAGRAGPAPLTQSILDPGAPNPDGRLNAAANGFCFCSILPGLDPSSVPDASSGLCSPHLSLGGTQRVLVQAGARGRLLSLPATDWRREVGGLIGPPEPRRLLPKPRFENKDRTSLDC